MCTGTAVAEELLLLITLGEAATDTLAAFGTDPSSYGASTDVVAVKPSDSNTNCKVGLISRIGHGEMRSTEPGKMRHSESEDLTVG